MLSSQKCDLIWWNKPSIVIAAGFLTILYGLFRGSVWPLALWLGWGNWLEINPCPRLGGAQGCIATRLLGVEAEQPRAWQRSLALPHPLHFWVRERESMWSPAETATRKWPRVCGGIVLVTWLETGSRVGGGEEDQIILSDEIDPWVPEAVKSLDPQKLINSF